MDSEAHAYTSDCNEKRHVQMIIHLLANNHKGIFFLNLLGCAASQLQHIVRCEMSCVLWDLSEPLDSVVAIPRLGCSVACEILVAWPVIEPTSPTL